MRVKGASSALPLTSQGDIPGSKKHAVQCLRWEDPPHQGRQGFRRIFVQRPTAALAHAHRVDPDSLFHALATFR